MQRYSMFLVCFIALSLIARSPAEETSATAAKSTLKSIPAAVELKSQIEKLKDAFRADYERLEIKKDRGLSANALARKLLDTAEETETAHPLYYAMLAESMRIALLANKAEVAFNSVNLLRASYAVDGPQLQLEVLRHFTAPDIPGSDVRAANRLTLQCITMAIDSNQFETALAMVEVGQTLAARLSDTNLSKSLNKTREWVDQLKSQELQFVTARVAVQKLPEDVAANLTAARYFALRRRDWQQATNYASKVTDDRLRSLVARELSLPKLDKEQLRLAEDWWEYADALQGAEKPQAQLLAVEHFESLVGALPKIDRIQAESRIAAFRRLSHPIDTGASIAQSTKALSSKQNLPAMIKSKGTGITLKLIPAGEFLMGSPQIEADRALSEGPQHRVQISAFYLAIYEVTQGEFEQLMQVNPSEFSKTGVHAARVRNEDTSRFPVEHVTWIDAITFCNKLSQLDGLPAYYEVDKPAKDQASALPKVSIVGGNGYRLPTEAEWEYACRANTTTPFFYGSEMNGETANVNGHAPYGTSQRGINLNRPTVVGSYPANQFGIFDLHGNVWEWCFDNFDEYAYGPKDRKTKDPVVVNDSNLRILRGGGYADWSRGARSANREKLPAGPRNFVSGVDVTGIRVAR